MEYKRGKKYAPLAQDGEQDMWVQEIDWFPIEKQDPLQPDRHIDCIEVYADSEALLDERVSIIIAALNYKEILSQQGAQIEG